MKMLVFKIGLAKVGLGRVRVEKKGRVGSGSKNKVDPGSENRVIL